MMKKEYYLLSLLIWFSAFFSAGQPLFAEEFPVVVEAEVKAILAAEQEGVLSSLRVDAGDRVKKGETLAVIFHKDLILKKEQYLSKQQYLTAQVENLTRLKEKKLVTDEELARAKMELAVNEKEISIFQTQIEHSKICSPFSGLVITRHIQPHEWVRPGQPVVELYDPSKLRVMADIPSNIALEFKSGESHTLFFPDINAEITAKFKVISPQIDVRSNTIKVYWQVNSKAKKKAHLLPGMKGVLRIGNEEEMKNEELGVGN